MDTDQNASTVTTATHVALNKPVLRPRVMSGAAAPSGPRPLSSNMEKTSSADLLQMNLELSRQLNAVLTKQTKALEQEIGRLQDLLRESNTFNIVVFGPPNDLSVAAITNNSDEGISLCSRISEMFHRNQQQLNKRGMTYAIIEDVPLNRMYDTPFSRNM